MIRPADLSLIGLGAAPGPTARNRKFIVDQFDGAWRVVSAGSPSAMFPVRDEAVDFATRRAREAAGRAGVGVVVVISGVQELHCFMPTEEGV